MKKNFKLVLALVLSIMMVLGSVALAADSGNYPNIVHDHTITIDNTDQNVSHSYEAYQVFKGNLNAQEDTLSDIDWGNGVKSADLITALKASTDFGSTNPFANVATAKDVAKVVATFQSTTGANEAAGNIDAFAAIVAANLATKAADFTEGTGNDAKKYTATVSGDGYYFIKDTTADASLDGGAAGVDTLSKYLLSIVRDTTIVAKDTGSQSDKKIVEGNTTADDNNVSIGDTINYQSSLDPIPNPTKYNTFKLEMFDTMDAGLTLTGIGDVKMGSTKLTFGTDYYYYVGTTAYGKGANDTTQYAAPNDPVGTKGSHTAATAITIVFKDAKNLILNKSAVGKKLTVDYTAVLNADAKLAPKSNDNTVHFEFSNDANHKYEGDELDSTDPKGVTPNKTVETYTTSLKIKKVDENGAALAGATFTIVSTSFNKTLVTAEKFTQATDGTYYLLKDGSYTETVPGSTVNGKVVNDTQYVSTSVKYKKETVTDVVTAPAVTNTYTLISDANGYIELKGIEAGTYEVTEAIAPDGYNLLEGTKTLKINWNPVHTANSYTSPTETEKSTVNGGFSLDSTSDQGWTMTGHGAEFEIEIQNNKGATLPSTGGIGTTIFYIGGSILVLAAAILLITKRRMSNND